MKITTNQSLYDEVLIDRNWIKNVSSMEVDAFMVAHNIPPQQIKSSFASIEYRTDIKYYNLDNLPKIAATFSLTFL